MKRFSFTDRDLDLIETITRRVRLLTYPQIAAIWWPTTVARQSGQRRVSELVREGWLEHRTILAHPPQTVDLPVLCWSPEMKFAMQKDITNVGHHVRSRWSRPAVPAQVYVASNKAANLFGSTAYGFPSREHWNHDLHLAAVYVHYRRRFPDRARQWIGEHALPKAGYRIKDPDAFLVDENRRVVRVIESAGKYCQKQLEQFVKHCYRRKVAFELW